MRVEIDIKPEPKGDGDFMAVMLDATSHAGREFRKGNFKGEGQITLNGYTDRGPYSRSYSYTWGILA